MSNKVTVTEREGTQTKGTLQYVYYYPFAITDKNGQVKKFEQRIQRCGIHTDDMQKIHFTVTLSVEMDTNK